MKEYRIVKPNSFHISVCEATKTAVEKLLINGRFLGKIDLNEKDIKDIFLCVFNLMEKGPLTKEGIYDKKKEIANIRYEKGLVPYLKEMIKEIEKNGAVHFQYQPHATLSVWSLGYLAIPPKYVFDPRYIYEEDSKAQRCVQDLVDFYALNKKICDAKRKIFIAYGLKGMPFSTKLAIAAEAFIDELKDKKTR